jgi:hypothetical protein
METILQHAQGLVHALLHLMPSSYQHESLRSVLGLFLEAQGHPLPQHCQTKSASALSRFFNHYHWSTRAVLRTTRHQVLQQIAAHPPRKDSSLKVLIDLTTLEKCGKFRHLSDPTEDEAKSNPWVRVLNGKRGLHLVVLYLILGAWRVPWSFCIWHGKGTPSPAQLACKLLGRVPKSLTQRYRVIVLADTEFGTVEFLTAVHKRRWRAVVGMRSTRLMDNGIALKQLYRTGRRGQQVQLAGLDLWLTVSWFWLKRSEGERELRFVVSTYPYSGVYLVRLGRQRWAIESFFKPIKHRFGLHGFGQKTQLGVDRWLMVSLITFLLVHWVSRLSPNWVRLDWGEVSAKAIALLLPQVQWLKLLRQIQKHRKLAHDFGFEIRVKPIKPIPLPC